VVDIVKPRRPRRARGTLTRDQIVNSALTLADQDGIESLSMPRLAAQLDCGVMTIYRYVADKGELLDAMAHSGLADLHLSRPLPTDPAGVMIAWGRALRATLLRHPSLSAIFLSRPIIAAGIVTGVEALLGALARRGVSPDLGVRAVYVVLVHTTGFVAWELPRTHRQARETYAEAWRQLLASHRPDEFPLTASAADNLIGVAGEEQFEFGLVRLAHGLFSVPA
jgi:TetR/AcrR family tetracycline transcriptional repressor